MLRERKCGWRLCIPFRFKIYDQLVDLSSFISSSERVFSKVNLIKTRIRNRVKTVIINGLVLTKENGGNTPCLFRQNTYLQNKSIRSPAKGGTGCYRFNYQPGS